MKGRQSEGRGGFISIEGSRKYVYSFETHETHVEKSGFDFVHSKGSFVELDFEEKPGSGFVRRMKPVTPRAEEKETSEVAADSAYAWMSGKIFVHSGLSVKEGRQLEKIVTANGGVVKSSTVLKTDYLIYDPGYGQETAKLKRAKELIRKGKNMNPLKISPPFTLKLKIVAR